MFLDLLVVFDDAVVHQGNGSICTDMGMGIDVAGFPVSSPTGVSDTLAPLQIRASVNEIREDLQPALGLAHLKRAVVGPDGHAGGVITPVFHALQSVQQDRSSAHRSHKANNSTHI